MDRSARSPGVLARRHCVTPPMTTNRLKWDVSRLSYEDWLRFFFDRRLLKGGERFEDAFFEGIDPFWKPSEPARVVGHLCQLCEEFRELGDRYSLPQINQGIW